MPRGCLDRVNCTGNDDVMYSTPGVRFFIKEKEHPLPLLYEQVAKRIANIIDYRTLNGNKYFYPIPLTTLVVVFFLLITYNHIGT